MASSHWYAQLLDHLQEASLLGIFLKNADWLSDTQLGYIDVSRLVNSLQSPPAESTDSDEDEGEDDATSVSPLGREHNTIISDLVVRTAVRAVHRRLNEGSRFEKKRCADDMVRRINRSAEARAHNFIKGDDAIKTLFTILYNKVLRQQLPAVIWMALAPYCPSAHQPSRPFPSSLILCTAGSLADSWFFSSSFYRSSKAGENLTDQEKEACESLSLFYNSGKVARKSEAQIIAMVRQASNLSKLFRDIARKHKEFVAPVPTDHAFGVCWRGPLESWKATPLQNKRMKLMCSLFPGHSPSDMHAVASCVANFIQTRIPVNRWNATLQSCRDLVLGNFYFAQLCGTPPPTDLAKPFRLWGSVAEPPRPAPRSLEREQRSKLCYSLVSAAHSLRDILRETFSKRPSPLSSDDMDRLHRLWNHPLKFVDEAGNTDASRIMRVLRRPLEQKIIKFRGFFTREKYHRALERVEKVYTSNPALFAVMCTIARGLSTNRRLSPADLLRHEYIKTACTTTKQRDNDRKFVNDLSSYTLLFKNKTTS